MKLKKINWIQKPMWYDDNGVIHLDKCVDTDRFLLALHGWKTK